MRRSILALLPIPTRIYRAVRDIRRGRVARRPVNPLPKNISGDRDLEWSWVSSKIPEGKGTALDFGPGGSYLSLVALHKGFDVIAIDREPIDLSISDPRLRTVAGDLFDLNLDPDSLDLVINCSTVEHVGLVGRYGIDIPRPEGDIEAMRLLFDGLKPGGVMLLTIPVGQDGVFGPMCRVYGSERIWRLIDGLDILEQEYFMKDDGNHWIRTDREQALRIRPIAGSWSPLETYYAIGCLKLQKPTKVS